MRRELENGSLSFQNTPILSPNTPVLSPNTPLAVQNTLTISTNGQGLTEFTREAEHFVAASGIATGLLTLFVRHTSCSLLIQENADPDVQRDLAEFLSRFVPPSNDPSQSWMRHTAEGPDDMPAHIKAEVLPVSLTVPVADGRLQLGTWQGLYLFEHRDRPHERQVVLHLA
jgi:secondary thiamine-phosphate synthase enzyme